MNIWISETCLEEVCLGKKKIQDVLVDADLLSMLVSFWGVGKFDKNYSSQFLLETSFTL